MDHPHAGESPAQHAAVPAVDGGHWSDSKADTVAVLVVFTVLLLAAIHFVMGGAGS